MIASSLQAKTRFRWRPASPATIKDRLLPFLCRKGTVAFSLLEMLVSMAIFILILVALASLLNMTQRSYRRVSGALDSFEVARVAFDTLTRTVRQATLLSRLGYDDPKAPTEYQLKSDLHFYCAPEALLPGGSKVAESSHVLFFQAPLGIVDRASLQNANLLLNATGFFIAYGDDPMLPVLGSGETVGGLRNIKRYRLFQWFQPREQMSVYSNTITEVDGIAATNASFKGEEWFERAINDLENCHPLADNVIALVILPIAAGDPAPEYFWNSRDSAAAYSHHRMPQALKIVMAVIDAASAAQLGSPETAPLNITDGLFLETKDFDADLKTLEEKLGAFQPTLNFRIFSAEVPLNASNTNL